MKRDKTIRLITGGLLAAALIVSGITAAQITGKQETESEEKIQTETALLDEREPDYTEDDEATETEDTVDSDEANEENNKSVQTDSENVEVVTEESEKDTTESEKEDTKETAVVSDSVFTENSILEWPVKGTVVIDYSMDTTTYFPTLNVYKCSQAMVINAAQGDPVEAAADGTVLSVRTDEETGNTVTVDMGNGFEAIYGQLTDIRLQEGDTVTQGEVIGYIAEATRYYRTEGDNLYFAITKDGSYVDPSSYMETESD